MNLWNAVFVSEMSHNYERYVESKDEHSFRDKLKEGLMSSDEFGRAFTAGLIEWLASRHFDIRNEVKEVECVLKEPAFPSVYEHPTIDKRVLDASLPEFRKYNIFITHFGK